MTSRNPPHADGGIALVEALAALVVVGMIGLMLMAGAGTGRRVWERIDAREARGEELESAQSALRDRVSQIYPATKFDASPPYIDFRGKVDQVVFLANPPEVARPAPLRRYTVSLDAAGNLALSSISDVEARDDAPVDRQVLLRHVQRLEIGYFGPAQPDFQPRWRDAWRDERALPALVRVRVAFEDGDPRVWTDLIIRTQTTIDSACLINEITHRCKGRA